MGINTKLVDLILIKRKPFLGDLLGRGGLDLENLKPNLSKLLSELDNVFSTLDLLEKEKLILIKRNGQMICTDFFNGFTEFETEKEEDVIFGQMFYYSKLITDDYAMSWQIEMGSGLLSFRNNGYKTEEQIKEERNFWLTIFIAILSPLLTAILLG